MESRILEYLADEKKSGYAKSSLYRKELYLGQFLSWCLERGIESFLQIKPLTVERYRKHLYYYRNEKGVALGFDTQARKLREIHKFFHYLTEKGLILHNPAEGIDPPRQSYQLALTLSKRELERIVEIPDTENNLGIRDRAILEVLYATGITREELWSLKIDYINLQESSVEVGEESKRRKIPLLARTVIWLRRYIDDVRPLLMGNEDETRLFLSKKKRPFACRDLSALVRKYKKRAGIDKRGSFTLFRHSLIVLLIKGAMDLRYIQEIMGIEKLDQLQRYSGTSIRKLKEVHQQTHPSNYPRKK